MESDWRQLAVVASGGIGPWRLVARLVNPILGFTHIAIGPGPFPQILVLIRLDTDGYANAFLNYRTVTSIGFPYGEVVFPD